MKGPIQITCPLCEKLAFRVEHKRDFTKKGLNVTLWYHGNAPCFVVDDLLSVKPRKINAPFEIIPLARLLENRP